MTRMNLAYPQWDGRRGWYEVYFVIVTDPVQRVALWLRWLLMAPHARDVVPTVSLWAMGNVRAAERFAYKDMHWSGAQVSAAVWQSLVLPITAQTAYARIGGGALIADLRWEPTAAPMALYPHPWMYTGGFPKSKSTSPVTRATATGTVQWQGHTVALTDATVSVGHFWGAQMAECWVWAQAPSVTWADADSVGDPFEAFTARIALGPGRSPLLTLAALGGAGPRWTQPIGWVRQQSCWTGTCWQVTARRGAAVLDYTCTADPATIIGVTYVAPDGSRRYCYHSDAAQIVGTVRHGRGPAREFIARDVRFETVSCNPNPDLALLL